MDSAAIGAEHVSGAVGAQSTLGESTLTTVKVYTRHNRNCPKRNRSDWARCNCMKWLYIYRDGKYKLVSAKTRSWEKAEQKARELRDSYDPVRQLQRQLEAKAQKKQVEIAAAVEAFLQESARLNRAEATRAKYTLTLNRLSEWCAAQDTPITLLSQLDIATLRRWIQTWDGAATTRHNQHQRVITFFFFCIEQGWITENPAKKIKKVTPEQDETQPFTREQFVNRGNSFLRLPRSQEGWRYRKFAPSSSVPEASALERPSRWRCRVSFTGQTKGR
jgi:hypothetical protein